ncbi:small VCP/p97-interacting protein-like [Lingula anatina]|uniref:Small VCP/p97-interacting protein n=1 Tax=Lingula anatina TaxID=7574 RepID=A0A1S3IQ68_LINAN|nr:small VCP/p97-interacting protein [Lingula anatina]XP_023933043.1 small VCP/p97-interacting protein-like [Lingula anatina]|eukprot:XP_013400365.1 small VCP/p97-interacting protein [Lingula anatina]
MGMCTSCLQGYSDDLNEPSPETKRKRQAEAAEKRIKMDESRGIRDPEAVKRKRQRQQETEEKLNKMPDNAQGLKWHVG